MSKGNDPDSVEGTEGDEEGIPWSFLLHCPNFSDIDCCSLKLADFIEIATDSE